MQHARLFYIEFKSDPYISSGIVSDTSWSYNHNSPAVIVTCHKGIGLDSIQPVHLQTRELMRGVCNVSTTTKDLGLQVRRNNFSSSGKGLHVLPSLFFWRIYLRATRFLGSFNFRNFFWIAGILAFRIPKPSYFQYVCNSPSGITTISRWIIRWGSLSLCFGKRSFISTWSTGTLLELIFDYLSCKLQSSRQWSTGSYQQWPQLSAEIF